ncbi:MAG TPA: hypothetical protein VKG79_04345 [Bryobacteraceae bacterium]|nr:hypothetical protein [Bryobacteraceae bacterium]
MPSQRIAAFVLGAWIMGSLFMIFVATQNFQMADAFANADAHAVGREMAGRLNQLFFVDWERAELLLGVAFAALAWFGARSRLLSGLSVVTLALVAGQHFVVTPRMLSLSAHLDNAAMAGEFGRLHAMYGISEVLKLVLLFALAGILLPSWRRRAVTAAQVHAVDYAHHGHIDR